MDVPSTAASKRIN